MRTFVWIAGLVLAAAGIVYAAVDVSNGTATTGAADSTFAPQTPAVEDDLVAPARAVPVQAAPKASVVDPMVAGRQSDCLYDDP